MVMAAQKTSCGAKYSSLGAVVCNTTNTTRGIYDRHSTGEIHPVLIVYIIRKELLGIDQEKKNNGPTRGSITRG